MRAVFGLLESAGLEGGVLAIGKFDGVHRGHRQLLGVLKERARTLNAPAIAVTFDPLPAQFFCPSAPAPLEPLIDRLGRLEAQGVDACVVLPFDGVMAELAPSDFAARVLCRLKPREIVVGADFCFGKNRAGTVETLSALGSDLGFNVRAVPLLTIDGEKVGTSRIRQLLSEGRLKEAYRLQEEDE